MLCNYGSLSLQVNACEWDWRLKQSLSYWTVDSNRSRKILQHLAKLKNITKFCNIWRKYWLWESEVFEKFPVGTGRVILAPLNTDLSKINSLVIDSLTGVSIVYNSFDLVNDQLEGAIELSGEFLNTVVIAYLPPHELKLKTNTATTLLQNLDISEGVCSCTCLIAMDTCNNITKAKLITCDISVACFTYTEKQWTQVRAQLCCTMQCHQFSCGRRAFAITVHKAQEQT